MTDRYVYADMGEYCCILDTEKHNRTKEYFKQKYIDNGYLDEGYSDEDIDELADEDYMEYIEDYCMGSKEVFNTLNENDELIKKLKMENEELKKIISRELL